MNTKKVCLIILDGWGHGRKDASNAIYIANTPFTDELYTREPHAELRTDGENVGLPEGQMGNSEVGHTNIGAGRIVYQDLVRINVDIRNGDFQKNKVLLESMRHARENNVKLHFLGLVSDGGVHSHIEHLKALCDLAKIEQVPAFVHVFTDGRDTDPKSGLAFIEQVEKHISNTTTKLASVIGRYYAMDRDKRWERVKLAYDLLVHGKGTKVKSAHEAIEKAYAQNKSDEFIEPSVICDAIGNPVATIQPNDVVICFNFRTDRCREITQVLTQTDMSDAGMSTLPLYYVTMANYDDTYKNVKVVYDKDNLAMTLGEVLSIHNKTQIRIAETEKYPHVTFFFSGGREKEFPGERRMMVASPKVATYDLQPEMSALEVTSTICKEMEMAPPDFICLNFANPDMVGHTGVFSAIVKAVETIDACLKKVVETGERAGYSFIVIADHGNADFAINDDGTPNTAHTTNPVPIWIIDKDTTKVKNGILADVAPTILHMMEIEKPDIMTGHSLI
ncbi:MAG: 2,3-bisphosphoglycerate-independent phosphoglycerate mutase [Flavobacteriales bacterium]